MLKIRILSAAIGLPLLIAYLVLLPPIATLTLFTVFALISSYETSQMMFPKVYTSFVGQSPESSKKLFKVYLIFSLSLGLAVFLFSTWTFESGSARGIIVGGLLAVFFFGTFIRSDTSESGAFIVSAIVSMIYGILPWIAIWDLYLMGEQAKYIFFLISIVWAGDTGAYFGGRFFGKHKLAPVKSPKKTWEGAIAGLLSSVIAAYAISILHPAFVLSSQWVLVSGVVCGVIGQMGDLVESNLKRFCGVKDSGGLIPGHGGLLDRADGLLFSGPALWFILCSILN